MNKKILMVIFVMVCIDLNSISLFRRNVVKDVTRITGELTEDEEKTVINLANLLILQAGKDLNGLSNDEYNEIIQKVAVICRDNKVQILLKLGNWSEKVIDEFISIAVNILDEKE